MKALVISDRQEIIDFVTPLLKQNGFDLIHYRWIIKALDNIEEIQPDVIVLCAGEYPRHWKTLAGFVESGIGGNSVKVYLTDKKELSADDSAKAEGLGIQDFGLAFLRQIVDVEVMLNCETGPFVFAKGKYYPEENHADVMLTDAFTDGSFIKYVTVFDGERSSSFSATAEKNKDDAEGYVLHIEKYYEKEI